MSCNISVFIFSLFPYFPQIKPSFSTTYFLYCTTSIPHNLNQKINLYYHWNQGQIWGGGGVTTGLCPLRTIQCSFNSFSIQVYSPFFIACFTELHLPYPFYTRLNLGVIKHVTCNHTTTPSHRHKLFEFLVRHIWL